jgi:hypothetical protein
MPESALASGTPIIALTNTGPVPEGSPGIVTGSVELGPFFWRRRYYMCTFFGNVKHAMLRREIDVHEHGRTMAEIERGVDPTSSVAEQLHQIRP